MNNFSSAVKLGVERRAANSLEHLSSTLISLKHQKETLLNASFR
jgi:hypothetical protein